MGVGVWGGALVLPRPASGAALAAPHPRPRARVPSLPVGELPPLPSPTSPPPSPPQWKLSELVRDPIWPPPPAGTEAAPEGMRLGLGRTTPAATDVCSLANTALTAWMAGDRTRFESIVSPSLRVKMKALGIDTNGAEAAWEKRSALTSIGALYSLNSPIVDHFSKTNAVMLMHGHLYDVATAESSGRPTAHLALQISFSKKSEESEWVLDQLLTDALWVSSGPVETEGLGFDSPELTSMYDRSLIFAKAWEAQDKQALASLVCRDVGLEVPRTGWSSQGVEKLFDYRETLGSMGMVTLSSIRITESGFRCYMHEHGVESTMAGLPVYHAGLKLDFERQYDGSRLISKVQLEVEYKHTTRRGSTFGNVGEKVTMQANF